MSDFIKRMLEQAEKEGAEIHVVHVNADEPHGESEPKDEYDVVKEEATYLAETNRILYEAHICAGFTGAEALALTVATISAMDI